MTDIPLSVKYRPKKLDDIIGQTVVVTSLLNAFKNDNLHHAYIFEGNLGSGKTSAARILAAMENCERGKVSEPCGVCDTCKSIFLGKSIEIKEIDAASNRGIDDIRSLKSEASFSPVNCRVKYYIIDEVHSLTGAAAEAALKLIEEPPNHVRFVLCTTDAHLLKDTIHSRCISYHFSKISKADIVKHLFSVAKQENIDIDEYSLAAIAKVSNGSVRNSLQLLQSVYTYAGENKIDIELTDKVIGSSKNELFYKLLDSILNYKAFEAINIISELLTSSGNIKGILDEFEQHLRSLLLTITCSDNIESFGFLDSEIKLLRNQAGLLHSGKKKTTVLLGIIDLLYKTHKGLDLNIDPQLLLEKFVIESIILKRQAESSETKKMI